MQYRPTDEIDESRVYTMRAAAEFIPSPMESTTSLGISVATLRLLIQQGRIDAIGLECRSGSRKSYVIRGSELKRFVQEDWIVSQYERRELALRRAAEFARQAGC